MYLFNCPKWTSAESSNGQMVLFLPLAAVSLQCSHVCHGFKGQLNERCPCSCMTIVFIVTGQCTQNNFSRFTQSCSFVKVGLHCKCVDSTSIDECLFFRQLFFLSLLDPDGSSVTFFSLFKFA